MTKKTTRVRAIDLFCGAGGLTKGLEKVGIDVRLGIDVDPECEYPYTTNNNASFLLESIEKIDSKVLAKHFTKNCIKLIAGCAPCQTFSNYNRNAKRSDKRWYLLSEFSRLVEEISPEIVTMENVPGLESQNIFKKFVENLEDNDYCVNYSVVNCADYGVPQHRRRLVLLASKLGEISLLKTNEVNYKQRSVKDAIGSLPSIKSGEIHSTDKLHQSATLSKLNLKRIKASKPSGTWRDWEKHLIADCHKKGSGKTYPSVYGRMAWDNPAPTITTQFFGFGNGRFGHPEQHRAISLREGAILQSFPKGYKFVEPRKTIARKNIGRMIGNAVPVRLAEVIGKSILKHLEKIN